MTEAQEVTLKRMPFYHILTKLSTGAVVVVFKRMNRTWMVVDNDGVIYDYRRYFTEVGQRS